MSRLPLFPLPETVVFPGLLIPLFIFEERYKQMTRDLLALPQEKRRFVITLAGPEPGQMRSIGGIVEVMAVSENPDGTFTMLTRGTERCRVEDVDASEHPYLSIPEQPYPLERGDLAAERIAAWDAMEAFRSFAQGRMDPKALEQAIHSLPDDPLYHASFLCVNLGADAPLRQYLLEAPSLLERFARLQRFIQQFQQPGGSVSA
ncbi:MULTISPECIES: LON peptidase substrate-binding domain-containing protein [unclassified Meiothermus]|uniref:LON peptidase substrate-binding domain-containing protein n=1 Tax=unclassified Meiothermus TaxID=370471 RepID=UPI000D7C1E9B|nr:MULTISPECIES: LON peptidase substrate-binding domain-containing protein [unclassified Meiothermus]PZA08008.1 peptidase S16 [Meiothermus sp. Pnk-1]RYM32213.1 peptidase S16 [Meiothermus sp. PNK-Is4]